MIQGEQLPALVALLERRGVSLFHACQYTDFRAYLNIGGIPSRALLEASRMPFTAFETDDHDRHNGVWDKVFVNLADFGAPFAKGWSYTPNAYGPILLQIHPRALLAATDVAVCYRSAGAADFNREREAMSHPAEVDELFRYPSDSGFPQSIFLKSIPQLQTLRTGAKLPEVSCTVPGANISFGHVIAIWTDPYLLEGRSLKDWVHAATVNAGIGFRLWDRSCREDRRALFAELLRLVTAGCRSTAQLAVDPAAGPALRAWASETPGYQFRRYARYLAVGTILPLTQR